MDEMGNPPPPAAPLADAEALYQQGQAQMRAKEAALAFGSFEQAAMLGHVEARIDAARMLLYGIGAAHEPTRAIAWLEQAEQAGSIDASYLLAMVAVGNILVPRDARIDQRTFAAVNAGHAPALLAAAIHFGRKAHPEDQALCVHLLRRAATSGDPLAAQLLSPRLRNGEGVAPEPATADVIDAELRRLGIQPLPPVRCAPPQSPPSPPRQLSLGDAWLRPATRLVAEKPRVLVVEGLLSADECRLLIATARPRLEPSKTIDDNDASHIETDRRTSSDAGFDPPLENLALRLVQARMASVVATEFTCAENLIVLRYAPGQQFHPHRDFLAPNVLAGRRPDAGNRAATVCVYLNDVDAGGATHFPVPGLSVHPRAGNAVAFRNLDEDDQPDPDSVHAGAPVESGEKWLATLWLRQRRYRKF